MPIFCRKADKTRGRKEAKRGKGRGQNRGENEGKAEVLIKLLQRKSGLSSSDEKISAPSPAKVKLGVAAEAIFDAKSKEEVLKLLGQ